MADITIGNMAPLDALSGKEQIPCEIDGKNYKITPDQIAPFVDIANIPTFDSITGQEKVIVVRDGKAQGLVTLTQIRQVVLPGYTYEDLTMDKFPELDGAISANNTYSRGSKNSHIEIPVPAKNSVFVVTCTQIGSNAAKIAFLKQSPSTEGGLEYCDGTGPYTFSRNGETATLIAPEDAKIVLLNIWAGGFFYSWSIQIGELIITTRLNELENRVNDLEQSPSPANISVSRDEFDALKRELESLKAQNTAVVGKETM